MHIDDLKKLIMLAKEHGLERLKMGEIELVLRPVKGDAPEGYFEVDPRSLAALGNPIQGPANEEDVLFWSAGGSGLKDPSGKDVIPPLVGEEIQAMGD